MSRPQSTASIGALAAAVLLLTGLAGARADELSDLRANQQVIEQRLDQLQQPPAPEAPDGRPDDAAPDQPTIRGGSFPRSFVIPGTNTSVTISGSIQQNFGFGRSQ
jgi:hypothetical protein